MTQESQKKPAWREEAHLGRAGEGCKFICSTLKSSANTGTPPRPWLPQSRRFYSRQGAAAAWQSSCPWDGSTREGCQHREGRQQHGGTSAQQRACSRPMAAAPAWRCPSTLGRASRLLPPPSQPRELQKGNAGPLQPQEGAQCCSWASPRHWSHLWDADGTRGCAQHPTRLAGGTEWGWGFPGTEVWMPHPCCAIRCCPDALPCFGCLSCFHPSIPWAGCEEEQDPDGVQCRAPAASP